MVAGNSTPRMGKSGRGGKRGAKMSYGGAEDEELAELQKRFHALEEEARVTAERAQSRAEERARMCGGAVCRS